MKRPVVGEKRYRVPGGGKTTKTLKEHRRSQLAERFAVG
jgi:hypothetical protein